MKTTKGIIPELTELLALRFSASNLQFFNDQRVHSTTAGERLSFARGRGMDFEEVRRYQPGDDIRLIHWPLTARLGKAYTKIYREERERAIYLVIDQSSAMNFGTRVCFKNVLAARAAAVLGWAALNHHEQIGGMVFNDTHYGFIKPQTKRQALLNLFKYLINPAATLPQQNGGLAATLQFLAHRVPSGSVVIVISDYANISASSQSYLRLISQKSEIINVLIYDPLEAQLPAKGVYTFTDSGANRLTLHANRKNNELYTQPFAQRFEMVQKLAKTHKMQFVPLATTDDVVQRLNHGILKYGY